MKNFYRLFIALFLLLPGRQARATHAAGMDLSYTCIGNQTYQFVATFYRDCAGISAPTQLPLDLTAVGCNYVVTHYMSLVFTTQGSDTISHLAGLCPSYNSTCVGGPYQGYEQYIYAIVVTLPIICSEWIAATHLSARNDAITNLQSPGSQDIYIECRFTNTNNICDNSPVFSTIPLAYSCTNEQFLYNHGAYDPDGDSLSFALTNSMNAYNDPIPYSSPLLSPTYPLFTTNGQFGFSTSTGQMSCTPNSNQIVVITVIVSCFRNGVKIASVMRDLQVVIQGCSNDPPQIPLGIQNVVGGTLIDSNTVQVCPGSLLEFDLVAVDNNAGNKVSISSNLGITIPGATYSVSGTNPATFHFVWQTTPGDTGTYIFTVTVKDDACPISGQSVYGYQIIVFPPKINAGPDLLVCETTPTVTLNVDGPSPYQWNNAQYLNDATLQKPTATLPGIGSYQFIVTAGVGGICEARDTVWVTVHEDYQSQITAQPDLICGQGTVQLTSSLTGGIGNYTYSWSSVPPGASGNSSSLTHSPTTTTQYILTSSSGGCVHQDTVTVLVIPLPDPTFSLPDELCTGAPAVLTYLGGAGPAAQYQWDFGGAQVLSGSGAGPYQLTWSAEGTYSVSLTVTDTFGCTNSYQKTISVFQSPTAGFVSETGGCAPFTVTFINQSEQGDTYLWDFGDGETSTEVNPTHTYGPGVYTVSLTVTTNEGCQASLTLTNYIEVLPQPIACATVAEDITKKYDISQATFHFTNCSEFYTGLLWDFGDGTTSSEPNPTHTYTYIDTFYVLLIAYNAYCSDTFKIGPIYVVYWNDVFFPTAFSPNNDGRNELFHELGGLGITSLYYAVYNRWGELLFETNNMNSPGWDGTYKGQPCEVGVYVWKAQATFINGASITKTGNVTLVR
ncbi:MAG: PKD domain-containing protein [Chitinophagales bacterium]|nr:PKD domain-containing protein [Chitinophagales bacterium]